jgi:hypothetical protein
MPVDARQRTILSCERSRAQRVVYRKVFLYRQGHRERTGRGSGRPGGDRAHVDRPTADLSIQNTLRSCD